MYAHFHSFFVHFGMSEMDVPTPDVEEMLKSCSPEHLTVLNVLSEKAYAAIKLRDRLNVLQLTCSGFMYVGLSSVAFHWLSGSVTYLKPSLAVMCGGACASLFVHEVANTIVPEEHTKQLMITYAETLKAFFQQWKTQATSNDDTFGYD